MTSPSNSTFTSTAIELVKVSDLAPSPTNSRTHTKSQIQQLSTIIQRFGFISPICIDENNMILVGHGRVEAAKLLGREFAPCVRVEGLTDAEKRAYAIADNKIALRAGWDIEMLAGALKDLGELEFDLKLTGFDISEIDEIVLEAAEASPKPVRASDDQLPALPGDGQVVSRLGDHWTMGRHRLACGDAKDPGVVAALMGWDRADAAFLDFPYNRRIGGDVSGKGRIKHREFAQASGEMTREEFTAFLTESLVTVSGVSRPGAIIFGCMDWKHIVELTLAGEKAGLEEKNVCVWTKSNGGMGTFYRSQHELITVWKVAGAPHTNTFGLGEGGRSRTNVWQYAGANVFKAERAEELASHPTVKPVLLVMDAIRDVTHRGEIVLDTFAGSGTTLIAAHKVGRKARLVEIDPAYCDVIVRRWEKLTGKRAVLEATGEDFEATGARRGVGPSSGEAVVDTHAGSEGAAP